MGTRISPACAIPSCEAAVKLVTVEMADFKVSDDPNVELVSYGLGSAIVVTLYEPKRRIGSMLHYVLPASHVAPGKADSSPAMFANTGIPLVFQETYKYGCSKPDLIVRVAGGGSLYESQGVFNIGERNYSVLKRILALANVHVASEDVGGPRSRTVRLSIATGAVKVKAGGEEKELPWSN